MYLPKDTTAYKQDARSCLIDPSVPDGVYVYVQDENGLIWILPNGKHLHPKVLGNGRSAQYAGDLTVETGQVSEITNCSGTFKCDDQQGLLEVAEQLKKQGMHVEPLALRFFPPDGSTPPVTLA